MKVLCIENLMWRTEKGFTEFKKGEIYDYDKPTIRGCLIKDLEDYSFKRHFATIPQLREININKIINE